MRRVADLDSHNEQYSVQTRHTMNNILMALAVQHGAQARTGPPPQAMCTGATPPVLPPPRLFCATIIFLQKKLTP